MSRVSIFHKGAKTTEPASPRRQAGLLLCLCGVLLLVIVAAFVQRMMAARPVSTAYDAPPLPVSALLIGDYQEDAARLAAVKININTADVDTLSTLPGIGDTLANAIIAYRQAQPFQSIEELLGVPGIGEKKYEAIWDMVCVE